MDLSVNKTESHALSLIFSRALIAPILLGLACFLIYNANLRQIGSGDTISARYLPLIILRDHTLTLEANARLVASGHTRIKPAKQSGGFQGKVNHFDPWTYWMIRSRRNELISLYPVVTPLIVAPLYVPAVMHLNSQGWEQPQIGQVAVLMEKLSASILASAASVVMYLLLRRERNPWALLFTIAFAFGTNTWMISSQALWQHGTGELLVALALLLVTARSSPTRMALLGAVCVLMAANRPPDALIAGVVMLFAFWSRGWAAKWLFAGAVAPLGALLYYNIYVVGHIAGAYAIATLTEKFLHFGWSGIAGLFVSPARGLFVFTPFLVFVPVGFWQRVRSCNSDERRLATLLSLAVISQILVYSQADWRAGVSWGPRWLTDLLPILVWMLAPAPCVLNVIARRLLMLTIAMSVAVQVIGAFWYTKTSDEILFSGDQTSGNGAWDFSNIPFVTELRHPPAGAELIYPLRGSLDIVGSTRVHNLQDIIRLQSGDTLEGWTLAGPRTPAQIVALIDGIIVGQTSSFFTRPDVDAELKTSATSGWRIPAELLGVPPGQRVLQLAARIHPRSDFRIFREQRVDVSSPASSEAPAVLSEAPVSEITLGSMASRAALLLREHQQKSGSWLTSHTKEPSYDSPQQEMNTFLTSMMVDMLSPVSQQHGLDDAVKRGREHLAAQIESNGLVRYHGLPDAPDIGKLGCVITPDSDDTALAWRVSGVAAEGVNATHDPRQQGMLDELSRYRDARGLYHTWLAPREQYQCLDPGPDPNPTDLTIQLHIYLMLRELDPPAAKKLCAALQRSISDEDVWVYYARAPLVPYFRIAEMRELDCVLPLPVERLALPAKNQEIWSEAIRHLVAETESASGDERQRAIGRILTRLGGADFSEIRRFPPLLYHNDLSATVKRFYWSEDFGYALWLRLYGALRPEARTATTKFDPN